MVEALPEPEAKLLAVYLEELTQREAEINAKLRNQGSGNGDIVEETIGSEDE